MPLFHVLIERRVALQGLDGRQSGRAAATTARRGDMEYNPSCLGGRGWTVPQRSEMVASVDGHGRIGW